MKKLLLPVVFVCGFASRALPSDIEINKSALAAGIGTAFGWDLGAYVDKRTTKQYFDYLKNQYRNYPEYIKKIERLEFNRATKFAPERIVAKCWGAATVGWFSYIVAEKLTSYIGKKNS